MTTVYYDNVTKGPPCPFTREQNGSHPKTELITVGTHLAEVCRHCGVEVDSQPKFPRLEEPAKRPDFPHGLPIVEG